MPCARACRASATPTAASSRCDACFAWDGGSCRMSRRVPRPCRGGMSCRWVSCGGRDEPDGDDADGCAARRCLRSLSCFSRRCRLALPTKQTSLASTLRKILPRGTDKPRERRAGGLRVSVCPFGRRSGINRSPTEMFRRTGRPRSVRRGSLMGSADAAVLTRRVPDRLFIKLPPLGRVCMSAVEQMSGQAVGVRPYSCGTRIRRLPGEQPDTRIDRDPRLRPGSPIGLCRRLMYQPVRWSLRTTKAGSESHPSPEQLSKRGNQLCLSTST